MERQLQTESWYKKNIEAWKRCDAVSVGVQTRHWTTAVGRLDVSRVMSWFVSVISEDPLNGIFSYS